MSGGGASRRAGVGRRTTVLLALGVSLAAFVGAGALMPSLNERRIAEGLLFHDPSANMPPELLAGKLLGSVRGWLINYLWIRATELQDRGQFHESLELMKAITRLQPRFARVWSFQANLMYMNLSKASYAREERWYWIEAGIELLHEGIELNPYSRPLHRELAWLFIGRIEPILDRSNAHYKRQFARQWHELLGPPPRERTREAFGEWLRSLTENGGDNSIAVELRERHGMDPELMLDLTRELGPLDWRHPAAHSLYWAAQGELRQLYRRTDVGVTTPEERHEIATPEVRRALAKLLVSGRVVHHEDGDYFTRVPEPGVSAALDQSMRVFYLAPGDRGYDPETPFFRVYQQLLEECVELSLIDGEVAAARHLYDRLRERFSRRVTGAPYPEDAVELPLWRALDDIEASGRNGEGESLGAEELAARRQQVAEHALRTLLKRSFSDGLANDRFDVARTLTRLAFDVHDECIVRGILEADEHAHYELQLAALREYFLEPPALASPFAKKRLWNQSELPDEFKRDLYGDEELRDTVRFQLQQVGIDPDLHFGPPPAKQP